VWLSSCSYCVQACPCSRRARLLMQFACPPGCVPPEYGQVQAVLSMQGQSRHSNMPRACPHNPPPVYVCCRFASEHVAAAAAAAAAGGGTNAGGASSSTLPAGSDPLTQPGVLSATAAADARRSAVRTYVVPLLIGLATTSSSTRAKLWASNGLDIFLQLLGTEVCTVRTCCCCTRHMPCLHRIGHSRTSGSCICTL
jgi:hypothetical protein